MIKAGFKAIKAKKLLYFIPLKKAGKNTNHSRKTGKRYKYWYE